MITDDPVIDGLLVFMFSFIIITYPMWKTPK